MSHNPQGSGGTPPTTTPRQRRGIRLKPADPASAFDIASAIEEGDAITARAAELEADSDLQADLERLAEYERQQEPIELACLSEQAPAGHAVSHDQPLPRLPEAMRRAPRWLVWKSIANGEKKPRKVPFYCNGTPRQGLLDTPEDRTRLATLDEALDVLETGAYTGLGFALGPDEVGDHWQGIDLDGTDTRPELAALVEQLPGYVERSPSGKGWHAIGIGRDFATLGSNASGIEAYAHGRYFTVTGTEGHGTLEDIADFVTVTLAPLHSPRTEGKAAPIERQRIDTTDQMVRDLRSALASMRSDDRDLWVRMGLALKPLGDPGRALWLEWSQTSEKFDPRDAARVWESFKPEGTGPAAVFAEAQRSGWINPAKRERPAETPCQTDEPLRIERERPAGTGANPPPPTNAPAPDREADAVAYRSAADFRVESIRWLWRGWLAAGKLHILAGAPGTGKTSVALALGATLTVAGRWPDGTPAPRGRVMIWSGEDDPTDTLVPRLMAAGADLTRVDIITGTVGKDGSRWFDPGRDMQALGDAIALMDDPPSLLIVDPIVSAVAGDSHKNAEVRRALQPLVELAMLRRCAVIGISHFSKGTAGRDPVERVTGSLAFGALARIVLATAQLPDEEGGGRILARGKSNIGKDDGGFRYELQVVEPRPGIETTAVLWGEAVNGTARALLGQAETQTDPEERSAMDDAKGFLQMMLANGPVPAKQIRKEASEAGHSDRTLMRAKTALGVESRKDGFNSKWVWALPAKGAKSPEECQECQPIRTGNVGTLRHPWHSSGDFSALPRVDPSKSVCDATTQAQHESKGNGAIVEGEV